MLKQIQTIGRRKRAVCRIFLTPGSGKLGVPGRPQGGCYPPARLGSSRPTTCSPPRPPGGYLPGRTLVSALQQPFTLTDTLGKYDIKAVLDGGGVAGQAGAVRLAIARALVKIDESNKKKLREYGLMTRDAREVERKKPGRAGARKRFQFSKR